MLPNEIANSSCGNRIIVLADGQNVLSLLVLSNLRFSSFRHFGADFISSNVYTLICNIHIFIAWESAKQRRLSFLCQFGLKSYTLRKRNVSYINTCILLKIHASGLATQSCQTRPVTSDSQFNTVFNPFSCVSCDWRIQEWCFDARVGEKPQHCCERSSMSLSCLFPPLSRFTVTDPNGEWTYEYRPCAPFKQGDNCTDVVVSFFFSKCLCVITMVVILNIYALGRQSCKK